VSFSNFKLLSKLKDYSNFSVDSVLQYNFVEGNIPARKLPAELARPENWNRREQTVGID